MEELEEMKKAFDNLTKSALQLNEMYKRKVKEIDELKERLSIYESDNDTVVMTKEKWEETKQEIERLNNIINELEKWLEEEQVNSVDLDEWTIIQVRDKILELKGE